MGFFEASSWFSTESRLPTVPQCGRCGLHTKCLSPKMPATGRGEHKILFVGEAPGETEDKRNEQFVGEAGDMIREILNELGMDLDDCWKTNALICHPHKNKTPTDEEIECCRANLVNTIRKLQPKVIVLLGHAAMRSLLPTEWDQALGITTRWVGWQIPSSLYNAWVCPTYHPSFVLRSKSSKDAFQASGDGHDATMVKKIIKQHVRAAIKLVGKKLATVDQNEILNRIELIPDPRLARKRLLKLAGQEGLLTFDYETTGLKPERKEQEIYTVSFCLNGEDLFACRLDPTCYPALSQVLLNPALQKIASNLKFEERWTRCKLGHPVIGWKWDCMLGAHVLDNRGKISSIKFQAFVHCGRTNGAYIDLVRIVDPYLQATGANSLNRIKEVHILDLLKYNGMDSAMEHLVGCRQMALFEGSQKC